MDVPSRKSWAQDEFLAWAEAQVQRYEFDGRLFRHRMHFLVTFGEIATPRYSAIEGVADGLWAK